VSEKTPTAISESTLNVWGIKLKVAVLDDGRRVIEREGLARLLEVVKEDTAK